MLGSEQYGIELDAGLRNRWHGKHIRVLLHKDMSVKFHLDASFQIKNVLGTGVDYVLDAGFRNEVQKFKLG